MKPISRIGIGLFCTEGQKYMRWIEKSEMGINILLCPMFVMCPRTERSEQ